MKKLKHEAELFKAALLAIYRLLVHDKVIQPLPEDQVAEASMRHKLALWYARQLPKDHPLRD